MTFQTTFANGVNPWTQEPVVAPEIKETPCLPREGRCVVPKLQRRAEIFNCLKEHPNSTAPALGKLLPHIRKGTLTGVLSAMVTTVPPMVIRGGLSGRYRYTAIPGETPSTKQQKTLEILRESPGLTGTDLAKKMRCTAHSMYDTVYALERLGEVKSCYKRSAVSRRDAKHFYLPKDFPEL